MKPLSGSSAEPTTVVIPLDGAQFLQEFGRRHLDRPAVSIPTHVTIISPFLPASQINENVCARVARISHETPSLRLVLDEIGRFADSGVLYLKPRPLDELTGLRTRLCNEFGIEASPPVFHVTLAGWHPDRLDVIQRGFERLYKGVLPLRVEAKKIVLFERRGDTWCLHSSYPLTTVDAAPHSVQSNDFQSGR
jgi:hypothetical protein